MLLLDWKTIAVNAVLHVSYICPCACVGDKVTPPSAVGSCEGLSRTVTYHTHLWSQSKKHITEINGHCAEDGGEWKDMAFPLYAMSRYLELKPNSHSMSSISLGENMNRWGIQSDNKGGTIRFNLNTHTKVSHNITTHVAKYNPWLWCGGWKVVYGRLWLRLTHTCPFVQIILVVYSPWCMFDHTILGLIGWEWNLVLTDSGDFSDICNGRQSINKLQL